MNRSLTNCSRVTRFSIAAALAVAALGQSIANGQVVISQVYGGGGNASAQYQNDFIEIFNRGSTAQSVNGWSVQYASTGGSTWAVTNLPNVTLNPGQYLLVQEAAGSGCATLPCGAPLPTPDATGNIAMSGTGAKVALCNATTALTGACPTGGSIVDFVGWGAATCNEGGTNAPTTSNTTAIFRAQNGCSDTDVNGSDFSTAAPSPRNTASPVFNCSTPTGACCNNLTGICTVTTQAGCTGTYQGDSTTCSPNPCPRGACCTNGICTITTSAGCVSPGVYQGDGSACGLNTCGCLTATTARDAVNGSGVTVCTLRASSFIDTVSSATVKSFQAQDTSGTLGVRGVTIFGSNAAVQSLIDQLSLGATFDLYGGTNSFNGLFEVEDTVANPLAIANITPGSPVTPYDITLADMQDGAANGEQLESVLVKTECVTFTNAGAFAVGNYIVQAGALTATVRVSSGDLAIVGQTIPTGPVKVTGILSQNDTTAPFDGGYQLLIREPADIEVCVLGACCNGVSCTLTTQAGCVAPGVYQGDNSTCSPSPCTVTPTGACCNAQTGVCAVTTQAACTGSYQGDNTSCDPNPCPQPATGACCNGGVCTVLTQLQCTTAGGTYTTDGSTCTVNSCACFTATSARALPTGSGITICNLKMTSTYDTVSSGTVKSIWAQDTSGTLGVRGINIFGPNAVIDAIVAGVPIGSTFDLYGGTQVFNGLFELENSVANPLAFGNVVAGAPATPYNVTLSQVQDGAADAEQLEGVLIKTECVTFTAVGNFAGATNYTVQAGAFTATVRVGTNALPIVGTPIPTDPVRLTCILSQFDSTPPVDGGYQLLLSDPADIEICSAVEPCNSCPGNFDGQNALNGRDIQGFVSCFLSSFGNAPSVGCGCVDMNGDQVVNITDLNDPTTGFIKVLLTGTSCP